MWRVKTRSSAGWFEPLISLSGPLSRHLGRSRERRPSADISAGAERDGSGLDEGSGRLEQMALGQPLEAARGQARWCPGRQTQVGEESRNHRGRAGNVAAQLFERLALIDWARFAS